MIDPCDTAALCADKTSNLGTQRPINYLSQIVIKSMITFPGMRRGQREGVETSKCFWCRRHSVKPVVAVPDPGLQL